jgi:hypothetical protein
VILILKGLTAQRLYKSFGVKGLNPPHRLIVYSFTGKHCALCSSVSCHVYMLFVRNIPSFLASIAKQVAAVSLVVSVCLSVSEEQTDSHRTDFHGMQHLELSLKYVDTLQRCLKADKNSILLQVRYWP